jgi:hypothetical protein
MLEKYIAWSIILVFLVGIVVICIKDKIARQIFGVFSIMIVLAGLLTWCLITLIK